MACQDKGKDTDKLCHRRKTPDLGGKGIKGTLGMRFGGKGRGKSEKGLCVVETIKA